MSTTIKYAYLKQQTWLYRRNYPKHLQPVLGQALKQSLKTGDARVANVRVNARFRCTIGCLEPCKACPVKVLCFLT